MPQEIILPYEPHTAQQVIHDSKARFKVLCCGRRFGKDRFSLFEVFIKAMEMASEPERLKRKDLEPRVAVWTIAPSFPMLQQIWSEIRAFFGTLPLVEEINIAEYRIRFKNGIKWELKSADKPETLVGMGLDILHVTETARCKPEFWDNVRPTLSSPFRGPKCCGKGIAIINSTPRGRNLFWEMYRRGQKYWPEGTKNPNPFYDSEWESWRFPTSANPFIPISEIDSARRGVPDDIFRQDYLAEFLDQGAGLFANLEKCTRGILHGPEPGHTYAIGVDIAYLKDYTVIQVLDTETHELVYSHRFQEQLWSVQRDFILNACDIFPDAPLCIDATGIGYTAVQHIEDALALRNDTRRIEGVMIEAGASEGTTSVKKEDIITALRMEFQNETISIPEECKETLDELQAYEFQYTKTGKFKYGAPPRQFDDCVMSLALALYACSLKPYAVYDGTYW